MSKSLIISTLSLILSVVSCHVVAESTDESSTLSQELGYFYGYSFGNMLKDSKSGDVDLDSLMRGLRDSLNQVQPALSQGQRDAIFAEVRKRQAEVEAEHEHAQRQAEAASREQANANLESGEAWLAENAKRKGVNVTESGLQYEIIEDKEGPAAVGSSVVVVNYRGSLTDGTVFDESSTGPVEFGLNQVIPGWTEGLQLMSAGDKFKIYLHPELAYGAGSVGEIPPNSVLIFDIELLEIK